MNINENYRSLSKEDKIHNLEVTKEILENKISVLQKQLAGVNAKISKYRGQNTDNA